MNDGMRLRYRNIISASRFAFEWYHNQFHFFFVRRLIMRVDKDGEHYDHERQSTRKYYPRVLKASIPDRSCYYHYLRAV